MKRHGFVAVLGIVLLISLLAACGGSPTDPNPNPSPGEETFTFNFQAHRTDRPVVNAVVQVERGSEFRTDSSGAVTFQSYKGRILRVTASGYVDRVMRINSSGTEYLLEDDPVTPLEFTQSLLYFGSLTGELRRPTVSSAIVGVEPNMFNDRNFHQALLNGLAKINGVDNNIQWDAVEGSPPAGSGVMPVRVRLDPNSPFWAANPGSSAYAEAHFQGHKVVDGEVVFKSLRSNINYTTAVAHELGHIRGLGHAPGGLMDAFTTAVSFNQAERELMRFAFLRPPGNAFPDDSSASGLQSSSGRRTVIMCAYPE